LEFSPQPTFKTKKKKKVLMSKSIVEQAAAAGLSVKEFIK